MPNIISDINIPESKVYKIVGIAIGVIILLVIGWVVYKKYWGSRISSSDAYTDPAGGGTSPSDPKYQSSSSDKLLAKINELFNKTICANSDEHEQIIIHLLTKNDNDLKWLSNRYESMYGKTLLQQVQDLSKICYFRFNGKKSELIDRLKSIGL